MIDVPTVAEELDRKAFEAVDYFLRRHTLGEITDDALAAGLQAIWLCSSGLVTESTKAITAEALKSVGKARRHQLRVFREPDTGKVRSLVTWTPGESNVLLLVGDQLSTQSFADAASAKSAFGRICEAFALKYQEFAA